MSSTNRACKGTGSAHIEHFLEHREEKFRTEFLVEGGTRIAQGLIKKFVIVDALSRVSTMLSGGDVVAFAGGDGGRPEVWAVWAYLAIDLLIFSPLERRVLRGRGLLVKS